MNSIDQQAQHCFGFIGQPRNILIFNFSFLISILVQEIATQKEQRKNNQKEQRNRIIQVSFITKPLMII